MACGNTPRQRFYLLRRDIEEQGGLDWKDAPRRENFFSGLSPQLREWLRGHNCDTLYCPDYVSGYEGADETVREVKQGYEDGLRKYTTSTLLSPPAGHRGTGRTRLEESGA